ncbi:MAG: hypothetical protein ACE5DU_07060 [Nitrosopumilus sp.]
MSTEEKLDSRYLKIAELTAEINSITRKTIDEGNNELSEEDVEHILKITSDVTHKIKSPLKELTV